MDRLCKETEEQHRSTKDILRALCVVVLYSKLCFFFLSVRLETTFFYFFFFSTVERAFWPTLVRWFIGQVSSQPAVVTWKRTVSCYGRVTLFIYKDGVISLVGRFRGFSMNFRPAIKWRFFADVTAVDPSWLPTMFRGRRQSFIGLRHPRLGAIEYLWKCLCVPLVFIYHVCYNTSTKVMHNRQSNGTVELN